MSNGSPSPHIFADCNTLPSLELIILPVCSSLWQTLHNSGISTNFWSLTQVNLRSDSFPEGLSRPPCGPSLATSLPSVAFLNQEASSTTPLLPHYWLQRQDHMASAPVFCLLVGMEPASSLNYICKHFDLSLLFFFFFWRGNSLGLSLSQVSGWGE